MAVNEQIVTGRKFSNIGFDTRLNNGVPEWSARGADTWSPFNNFDPYKNIIKVGSGESLNNNNIKITHKDFAKFTTKNFFIDVKPSYKARNQQIANTYQNLILSYNPTTGILTTGQWHFGVNSWDYWFAYDIYLIF